MKKIFVLIALISLTIILSAGVQIESNSNRVQISIRDNDDLNEEKISQVLALPARSVDVKIQHCEIEVSDSDGNLLERKTVSGEEFVKKQQSFVMRELFAHQIDIDLAKTEKNRVFKVTQLDLEIVAKDKVEVPAQISQAFLPIYRNLVDNFDESYLGDLVVVPSSMLILSSDNDNQIATLQFFTDWKNAKGIQTEIFNIDDLGSTPSNADIKEVIQNVYEQSDNPPSYVVLVGDVVGNDGYQIPAFTIHSGEENDVTDHPYTMLDGDDYFPEVMLGRISVDNAPELQTVIFKVLKYEKEPYMGQTHWFENATLSAGNYSSSPPPPTTPVKTVMWLRDKMFDYGYNNIDEFYYWPDAGYNAPGSLIAPSINAGVGIVAYRGWGDANGWHHPHFHREELDDLTNGFFIPIMTSIVCNTGDYANSVDPCFGEKWVSMGSVSNPAGGVVFLGPSDLHTRTKYNNAIFAGFYQGLLDEGVHSFGAASLLGKWELWKNFPLIRQNSNEVGAWVKFYFHVYNILGDPSIDIWTKVPEAINCTLPDEISQGTNYLDIDLTGMDGAVVTAIKADQIFETEVIENGAATLYFNCETLGEITVTITKPNYHPFIHTINVVQEGVDVGIESYTTASAVVAGQTQDLQIALKNFGTDTALTVSANLTTENPHVNIVTTTANFGDITSGSSATQSYEVEFLSTCSDNENIEFDLAISTGSTAKFEIIVSGLVLEVMEVVINDENQVLDPLEESDLSVTLKNLGSFETTSLTASLVSLNDYVTTTSGTSAVGILGMNEQGVAAFTVSLNDEAFIGENLQFRVDISDAAALQTSVFFSLEAGEVNNYAPTGPDSYGYYAYDSHDGFYKNSPVYEWIEIDPQEGGSGNVELLGDDRSFTVPAPFNFQYYGEVSDSITICTNGWISMQPTWETYFRNWSIPSALGPYGGITPFWDDMVGPYLPGSEEERYDMRICYYNDTENHRFIVEWNECVNREDNLTEEKFEVVLYDPVHYPTDTGDGVIQFNYQSVSNFDSNDNYATVGIENFEQNDGLLYSFADIYPASATHLQDGLSIKFTTDEPEYKEAAIPTSEFSAEIMSGTVPLIVNFNNDTTPMYYFNEYSWDFGDSETSADFEPEHLFDEVGIYSVTLTVTNSEGTDTIVKESFIEVNPPVIPETDFMVESIAGFAPYSVTFINLTIPETSENTYVWNFGDEATSSTTNPSHTYEVPGIYTVSLTATNSSGSDEMIKENYIIVIDSDEVWPGDTNSDGTVDAEDIMPIGFYWRKTGAAREQTTFNWQAYPYPLNWDMAVAPFADCNGDGEVDIADVLAICLNWNETHPATTSFAGNGDLEEYHDNFQALYSSLDNSGTELILKNHIAQQLGFPIVTPQLFSKLDQNYPNPFNPTTHISYSVAETGKTELVIFNIKGQQVNTLVNGNTEAGDYQVSWSGKDEAGRKVSSGLYFYRLKNNNKTIDTKKMLLLK